MMRTRRRRVGAITATLAMIGSLLVGFVATAPIASASTTQSNGCLGITGTFSTFGVPITGTASPNPINAGATTTLSGTSVAIAVDAALVATGVTAGLVTAAPNLASVGTTDPANPTGPLQGQNAVTGAIGSVKLSIHGTNTVEGNQTAQNTAAIATTFWVVSDSVTGVVTVYTGTPNPPTNTNLVPVTSINVLVPLGNTTWTSTAGNIALFENTNVPSNLTAPTPADKTAAPLQLAPKINGAINVPFFCWNGAANAAGTSLVPGAASNIDSVTVNTPPTAPVCGPFNSSVGGSQSTTVDLTTVCHDVNGDNTINWSSLIVGFGNPASPTICTAYPCTISGGTLSLTATPGVLTYQNTNALIGQELFGFAVSDSGGLLSNQSLATINVLSNDCNATTAACNLTQVLSVTLTGTTLNMHQAGQFVTLAGVTLNGDYAVTNGNIQPMTITNARGTAAGWAVTGMVTDFTTTGAPPGGCASAATYNRLCIPGNNLGWGPSAGIIHTVIPGDVAQVTAGATGDGLHPWTSPVNGSGSGSTLCSSPANHSGGTFLCNAIVWLGVPASAGAGTYTGNLTLTLA